MWPGPESLRVPFVERGGSDHIHSHVALVHNALGNRISEPGLVGRPYVKNETRRLCTERQIACSFRD